MDGDTAGGLAPLGGIDKTYLRTWLTWMEAKGPLGLEPVPALLELRLLCLSPLWAE
jgi:NAD+ synthase (glutamine-hydrolysing)